MRSINPPPVNSGQTIGVREIGGSSTSRLKPGPVCGDYLVIGGGSVVAAVGVTGAGVALRG